MPTSPLSAVARAFVHVLLVLARAYFVGLTVNRDSSEDQLLKAYKKLLLKAHPDKRGRKEDLQKFGGNNQSRSTAEGGATRVSRCRQGQPQRL